MLCRGWQVRNARLAMLATLGFFSQAATTGKGPFDNLSDHLSDPGHQNSEHPFWHGYVEHAVVLLELKSIGQFCPPGQATQRPMPYQRA